jgi:hypothetical protein
MQNTYKKLDFAPFVENRSIHIPFSRHFGMESIKRALELFSAIQATSAPTLRKVGSKRILAMLPVKNSATLRG